MQMLRQSEQERRSLRHGQGLTCCTLRTRHATDFAQSWSLHSSRKRRWPGQECNVRFLLGEAGRVEQEVAARGSSAVRRLEHHYAASARSGLDQEVISTNHHGLDQAFRSPGFSIKILNASQPVLPQVETHLARPALRLSILQRLAVQGEYKLQNSPERLYRCFRSDHSLASRTWEDLAASPT